LQDRIAARRTKVNLKIRRQQIRIASHNLIIALAMVTTCAGDTFAAAREPSHMPESLRTSMRNVVVVGGPSPVERDITGSYEKVTPGLAGGISGGAAAATPSAQVGPVSVNFPFPILQLPGAIIGGISGKAKRDIQEFRDAMAEDLAAANNRTLINDGLALDVYRDIQRLPRLEASLFSASTEIPAGTDAVLYVRVKEITIDVQDKDAVLTAAASVTLETPGSGSPLYSREIRYQDRARLEEWIANDNALWRDFANYARHYLGREISADSFLQIEMNHELVPVKSDDIKLARKNSWQGKTDAALPTLAWNLSLLGDDAYGAWTDNIGNDDIVFDLEIYDEHRMVYEMKEIAGQQHTLVYELDPCKTYRWSVRPTYHIDNDVRVGEWMQYTAKSGAEIGKGIVGRDAVAAPAYTQNFAALELECR
jgi:hypothetical protein